MADSAHSEEQFGPQRDFWWNHDFLDLMAVRWRLREARSLADIGCGQCHWSRLLYPYLRAPAKFTGVDREPRWVAEAGEKFRGAFPQVEESLLGFVQGDATRIPLQDNSFDVVTCQTVLMHLALPMDGLREMHRILRPGGLLVCVEPNNFWNYVPFTSLTPGEPVEALAAQYEFWLRYHRGTIAVGEGDHTIGDLLPGYFNDVGLKAIEVYQSDRVPALFPPYASPAQQATLEQEQASRNSGSGPWDRENVRRLVLAGGGSQEFFERVFRELTERFAREQKAIGAGRFHAACGGVNYLVSGRKE